MGLTYFKRFRMELDLTEPLFDAPPLPPGYELVPWTDGLSREHAMAKYQSFHCELDANVFPCLGRRDGCVRLMREIARRSTFVPEATWLLRHHSPTSRPQAVGTVQGLRVEGWGAIQNLGVTQEHRGYGLGTILMAQAAAGFRRVGLAKMHLEVTTANTAAVRLYRKMGFRQARTVFKAAEVSHA
ncbi:GNAT family N-acetyltransferase [Roseimaritima ulvae]|uniref:Putative acetyltransferase n=1 Tax=Roseimaritima ulvae TaxID=980254 RepID=A0A5B9QQT8_9BACT|nr:GNAT family N-acetyltransferase [Roseimaritima ulvae]QEG40269.1 putative acetyltransferase [Roseimaritima ulvae]